MIGRKRRPHDPPLSVSRVDSVFLITICSKHRDSGELLFLVRPDHVHSLFHFHDPAHPMRKALLDFKRWTARTGGFHWQTDFFDHRLRGDESAREKADYILMNSVRAGLVESPDEWPHRFTASDALG